LRAYRANRSVYAKQKEASCKTPARLNQTPEARQKRAEYMRAYRAKRSADAKQTEASYKRAYKAKKTLKPKEKACESQSSVMKQYRTNCKASCIQDFIYKFHNIVSQGPMYICSCCDLLWYRHSVKSAHKLRKSNPSVDKYLLNKTSVGSTQWICISCGKYLIKNKVPPCVAVNGMKFPNKPAFFDLIELEYRLLASRLAFQKLMQAPRGKQFKINGNIVYVPVDVTNSVSLLPRLPNEARTIKGNLKRKLQCKSSALSVNVRPHKVVQAAKWLINNSALYKEEGIALCENSQNSQESDFDNSVHYKSECNPQVEASNTDSETLSTFSEGLLLV